MPTVLWILLGLVVWILLGAGVALLVGRMVRQRDRQVPEDVHGTAADTVPDPRNGSEQPSARSYDGPAAHRSGGAPPA